MARGVAVIEMFAGRITQTPACGLRGGPGSSSQDEIRTRSGDVRELSKSFNRVGASETDQTSQLLRASSPRPASSGSKPKLSGAGGETAGTGITRRGWGLYWMGDNFFRAHASTTVEFPVALPAAECAVIMCLVVVRPASIGYSKGLGNFGGKGKFKVVHVRRAVDYWDGDV